MLESLLSKGSVPISGVPVLGYDYNKGLSTGSVLTTSNHLSTDIAAYSDTAKQKTGYDKGLAVTNKQLNLGPVSALNLTSADFTLEFWLALDTGPSGYTTFFTLTYDNGKTLSIRIGDSGFGNRLQFSFYAAILNANMSTSTNRTTFGTTFHHIALVREKNTARFYLDGVQQALATGTGSTYNVTDPDVTAYVLKNITSLMFGGGNYKIYMPEWAFWIGAKYKANFTPPKSTFLKQ